MENTKSPNKAIIAAVVIVLLVIAATATIVMSNNKPKDNDAALTTQTATDMPTTAPTDTDTTPVSTTFKDGTYSSTGSYQTPGGQESIGVKVTLANSVITDASVTKMGQSGEAQEYQTEFANAFKSKVVGKKVSEVKLDRVAGSSLTSNGFNNALSDIEKQAQS